MKKEKRSIKILNQVKFIEFLTSSLLNNIEQEVIQNSQCESNIDTAKYMGLNHYTAYQNDIIKIRRELMNLSKLIDWRYRNDT